MRLRTKLFLTWGSLMLLLWAATLWPIQRTIASNFAHIADESFTGTRRNLDAVRSERINQMRQACWLIMNIPELRALIAEDNYEISETNLASLVERLDGLTEMVGVNLVCVLDNRGRVIAQNRSSPWATLGSLKNYLAQSPQSTALIRQVFTVKDSFTAAVNHGTDGLWSDQNHLYEVVGVPLIFGGGEEGIAPIQADGALIMAAIITDDLTVELGKNHNCEISFLANESVVASSLHGGRRDEVERESRGSPWKHGEAFETTLNGIAYRSWLEPLHDPSSNLPVGAMLVQSSMAHSEAVQKRVSRVMLGILISGLLAAALASFLLSGAVTQPLGELVNGVRKVAAGELDLSLRADRHDEVGELASAFNDMVSQLRTRQQLQRLVEESQAASRAKSQFLANMSHEIRTPLNGVVGTAQLLLTTKLDERQRRYAGLVKSSAEVLTSLINDVLDFSKIEAGKMELESIPFSPHSIVEDVVEMLAPKAYKKGLEIACDVGSDLPITLIGDPNRIRQVLMNMLNNAVKFTETGEVIVRASCEARSNEKATIRFSVIDTGIGIPTDRRDRLFQSFSQIDASTTRKYGGTGLGLAICKQLAELMGGTIGVESQAGHGSTFSFTAAFAVQAARTGSEIDGTEVKGLRVLIADAHMASGEIVARRCKEWGIDAVAVTGYETIRAALTGAISGGNPFTAALIAPEAYGMTALKIEPDLRSCPGLDSLCLFLLLRTDQNLNLSELKQAGFSGYLTKPVRRSMLIDLIQTAALGPEARAAIMAERETTSPTVHPPPSIRRHARILLAEDHEVNQLIVIDMLANAGFQCDVVGDGSLAVDAWESSDRYDLILMDCQMPNMDGFEATHAIRSCERVNGVSNRIPIIALTANATSGDRQKCLDTGMDGYCSKPIDAALLIQTIESFLPAEPIAQIAREDVKDKKTSLSAKSTSVVDSRSSVVLALETDQPSTSTSATPLDYDALLRRCSGKSALAGQVLQTLANQISESIAQLQSCLNSRDAHGLARAAHGLKGAAGMATADNLRQAAARLEELGDAGDLLLAEQSLAAMRHEVRRCEEFIHQVMHKNDNAHKEQACNSLGGTP